MTIKVVIYLGLLFIIFLTGVVRFRRHTTSIKVLIVLIGLTFLTETATKLLANQLSNIFFLYHIYANVEYISIAIIYYQLINEILWKRIIVLCIPVYVLLWLINVLFSEPLLTFPSHTILLSQILYLSFSLLLFKQFLNNPTEDKLYKKSIFILNIAVLFFAVTGFLSLGLFNYFQKHRLDMVLLGDFGYIINMIYYIMLALVIVLDDNTSVDA